MSNKFGITLFFIIFLFSQSIIAQLSKKHYIPPLTNAEFGNANPESQFFYISTPNTKNVTFTITPIGQPSSSVISGIVSNSSPIEIDLGNDYGQLFIQSSQTSLVKNDKGYIIEAEDVIYVSLRVEAGGDINNANDSPQAGALVSKGLTALGNTFRVGAFTNQNPQTNYLNFVSVLATKNNTVVTFDDLPAGLSIKNYSGSFPVVINLNEGESYTLATNSAESVINRDGLIGALVTSNNPIVVNTGSANGSFHNGGGRDYGIDQIVDANKTGNEYIFVKGNGSNSWENILIVAHEDDTSISINGNPIISTINAGEYYLIEGDNYNSNENMYVNTSKNVFAYQGIGANGSEANQGLFFVPPLSCENRGNVNSIANIEKIGDITYSGGITIITNKNASVTLNAQPISNFSPQGPFDVDGNPNYVTYKVTGLSGSTSIESTGELYCAYFNFNGAATSGSFYSGFPSAPEINLNTTVTTLGTCIPNVTLTSTNIEIFDQFEWFFDDGTGYKSTGIKVSSLTPTLPGNYKLIGTINCSGIQFESTEIPVSICPDDYDNDGIIDNKDIDIDNDGILNITESKGNASVNLLNINNPIIQFNDGSSNSTIINSSFSEFNSIGTSNSFSGDIDGNFISSVSSANASNLIYSLNFTEPINFNFTESTSTTHLNINGEYFILKIAPSNKNITLLDPDNQLLVDTNFDGIFESGVLDFSASEIRFKYNSSSTGSTSFKFIANQITQISFEHHLSNLTESSVFNGKVELTSFDIDTDNDGIPNSFDLDSDNDGIPDIIEKNNTLVNLLNSDVNNDGLDDVFDINILPSDTDLDGILNFIDIDSDNDGIFDLEESGHGLLDENFDGFIDNAILTIGINGFVDALETFPDSNIIKYVIVDTDTDSIFNYTELDSDGDSCNDVIEAGFTDDNNDGFLGNSPLVTDSFGKVTNSLNGYTNPNIDYLIFAPIILNSPFDDVIFCEGSNSTITIDSNADSFQWQISIDGNNWLDLTENSTYNNVNTASLLINDIKTNFNNHQFRVKLEKNGNSCGYTSNSITLTVNPKPIFITIPVYEQCDIDSNPIDGITVFNLVSKEQEITNNNPNIIVDFFEISDANYTQPILNKGNYINGTSTILANYILNVRLTNTITGCTEFGSISLKVNPSSLSNYPEMFACEVDLNANNINATNSQGSGNAFYDFDAKTNDIILNSGGAFSLTTHTFEYYRTSNDAALQLNQITSPYTDDLFLNNSDVFVRIANLSTNACSGIGQFKVFVNTRPIPQGNLTPIYLCVNNPIDSPQNNTVDLNADTGISTDTYQWFLNGNLITGATNAIHKANVEGTYYVEAYRKYANDINDSDDDSTCIGYNTFTVIESNKARIIDTEIIDDIDNPELNKLIIKTTGIGIYEYALNSTNPSSFIKGNDNFSFTFDNVLPGLNTVYINDINGCGITTSQKFSFLFFQRHFTPNNDGVLDTWKILGINNDFYQSARIEIFDRYGKVIALITEKDSEGWNGTYNGKNLPSNDYWFNAVLEDINGNIRKKTGHFSLLRK